MWLKLRNWMLKVLAGKSPVMMNVLVQGGVVVMPPGTHKAVIYGNTFRDCESMEIVLDLGTCTRSHVEENIIFLPRSRGPHQPWSTDAAAGSAGT